MSSDEVDIRDVFELFRSLVEDARTAQTGGVGPSIVPVLLGEPKRLTDLIKAAFAAESASVVVAREWPGLVPSGDEAAPALGTILAAVEDAIDKLTRADPGSYAGTTVDVGTPESRGIIGTTSYDGANSAQKAAREILGAAFHHDLRTNELIIFVWDDSPFEGDVSQILFGFAQGLPEALQLGPKAVLVVVVGDRELRSGYHCVGERGVRYSVTAQRGYESREPIATSRQRCLEWLRNDETDAALEVLFLGAGTSVSAGLKTGNELRDEALGRWVKMTVDSSTFAEATARLYEMLKDASRLTPGELDAGSETFGMTLTLERILREEQHAENSNLCHSLRGFQQDHEAAILRLTSEPIYGVEVDPLRSFVESRRRLVLVTVNFDHVVETRCHDLVQPYATEGDLAGFGAALARYKASGGLVPLLKLHGDIGQPETLVANSDETAGGLSASRLHALRDVRNALEPSCPWWYVGYSMRDLDLLPEFASQTFSDSLMERWVSPILDPNVRRFVRDSRLLRWQAQRRSYTAAERAISLSAEEFWQTLESLRRA